MTKQEFDDLVGKEVPNSEYKYDGANAGAFYVNLYNPRSSSNSNLGLRSAYYRKLETDNCWAAGKPQV